MSWKRCDQLSLADGLLCQHSALHELDNVDELLDWRMIEQSLSNLHTSRLGNGAYPPLLMFKSLIVTVMV